MRLCGAGGPARHGRTRDEGRSKMAKAPRLSFISILPHSRIVMAWSPAPALSVCTRVARCSGSRIVAPRVPRGRALHSSSSSWSSSQHSPPSGPTARYNELVEKGMLKDDDHQRGIVAILQGLHEELTQYEPPKVTKPLGQKKEAEKKGFVSICCRDDRSA